MDINFDNVYTLWNSPFFGWMVAFAATCVLSAIGYFISGRIGSQHKVGSLLSIASMVGVLGFFICAVQTTVTVYDSARSAVKEAAKETYGIDLYKTNLVDLDAKYISEDVDKSFYLFGTTTLSIDGDITEVKLVWNEGEYQLVAGESIFEELPKVK